MNTHDNSSPTTDTHTSITKFLRLFLVPQLTHTSSIESLRLFQVPQLTHFKYPVAEAVPNSLNTHDSLCYTTDTHFKHPVPEAVPKSPNTHDS